MTRGKISPFVEDVAAAAADDTLTPDDRDLLIDALDAVPRAEADRLRGLVEQHRRDIFGPDLLGIPCAEDVALWEAALDAEDGDAS